MLHAGKLLSELWDEMVSTVVYLHNRIPNQREEISVQNTNLGNKPRLDHLRIIGSDTYVGVPKTTRTK